MGRLSRRYSWLRSLPARQRQHYGGSVLPQAIAYQTQLTTGQRAHFRAWSHKQLVGWLMQNWSARYLRNRDGNINRVGQAYWLRRWQRTTRYEMIMLIESVSK